MNNVNKPNGFNLFCIAVAILFGVQIYLTPRYLDDFVFSFGTIGLPYGFESFGKSMKIIFEHTDNDVVRVANFAIPFVLGLMPAAVFAILSAMIVYVLLRLLPRVCCPNRTDTAWAWVAVAAVVLLLPWYSDLFTVSYFLNYAGASAMILLMLWCLHRALEDRPIKLWASVPVCFLAGWVHEGFSMPLAVGMLAAIAVDRSIVNRRTLAVGLPFAAGCIFPLFFPAIWFRSRHIVIFPLPLSWIIAGLALAFLGIAAMFTTASFHKTRRRIGQRQWAFICMFGTATFVSLIICYRFFNATRAMFIPQFMGIGTLLSIFPHLTPDTGRRASAAVRTACLVLAITNMAASNICELRFRKEYDFIVNEIAANGKHLIFHDREKLSVTEEWLTLGKVSRECFGGWYGLTAFHEYYHPECKALSKASEQTENPRAQLSIVPSALRNFNPGDATPLDSSGNLLKYGECFIASENANLSPYDNTLTIETAGGDVFQRRAVPQPFPDRDGNIWRYIYFAPSAFPGSEHRFRRVWLNE